MAWKNVQYENGKMRTNEGGGGGGSSTFAGLDDVSFLNLQNGQVPKYNSTTQKWENADESGGGGTVTDVKVDGQSVVDPQTGEAEITMPNIPVQDVTVDGTSVVNQQGVAEIAMPTPPTIPVTDVKVNGTSVVDGNKEAQIKSYKEVTQAQYNALPASKTSDGILYAIKDVGGADGFPPLIYSDEEREVGVWRDGKPLYQKTINFGSLPDHTGKSVAHGIQNLDRIVNYSAVTKNDAGTTFLPLPRAVYDGQYILDIYFSSTDVVVVTYGDRTAHSVYVTLQYTKATDIVGSGTWTTKGGYAHHYSTNEHIIGTWIDGKPLYEKVITQTLTQNTSASIKAYPHNIPNVSEIVLVLCKENRSRPTNSSAEISIAANATELVAETGQDRRSYTVTVILQYTKTTD